MGELSRADLAHTAFDKKCHREVKQGGRESPIHISSSYSARPTFCCFAETRAMTQLWSVVRSTQALQNYGENPCLFTARASYIDVRNDAKVTRGVLLDIDPEETLSRGLCGERCGNGCRTTRTLTMTLHVTNFLGMAFSILALNGFGNVYISLAISLIWLCGPIHMICNANRKILRRQLRYSGRPWFQLYLSAIQTYALIDLFQYDVPRLLLVVPPLLTGLISLTISDAVYIKESERSSAIIDVLVSLLWQVILAIGVRYNLFDGMRPRGLLTTMAVSDSPDILFQNSSLFCGKCMSIVVMLISQIIFRIRHADMAFSLRANYSILSNSEWAKKEARYRVFKRKSLESSVRATKNVLGDFVRARRVPHQPLDAAEEASF